MSDPLVTYVNDHLGGARIAVELLEAMQDQHDDKNCRDLATVLLLAIQADDHTLRAIAEKIGTGPSAIKEVGGWIVEKAARLKLGHTGSTDFAMFESLELLAIGIHGKLCLWKALQVASRADSRLHGFDFDTLISRAQQQYDRVERNRLHLAQTVLMAR
ncbi:hypothetical protein [Edaphobacter modestus]|uniref:Ferritin-like metal-binding protein YciE n=1 Tax=Edaphobacter modestus TaxID=388466 RepID=A0A4V2G357_9BACT|nr:hypothetical protein [Edaphobacter modestus]RZU35556.1 hypothetical protein BDD14_5621 [Edaphobacter modestus]